MVVDGPPESSSTLARFPALPRLIQRLAKNYIGMLDDADRPSELEIVSRWMKLDGETGKRVC